jgi:hypothetical protein
LTRFSYPTIEQHFPNAERLRGALHVAYAVGTPDGVELNSQSYCLSDCCAMSCKIARNTDRLGGDFASNSDPL